MYSNKCIYNDTMLTMNHLQYLIFECHVHIIFRIDYSEIKYNMTLLIYTKFLSYLSFLTQS